jgi:hypothetical protein
VGVMQAKVSFVMKACEGSESLDFADGCSPWLWVLDAVHIPFTRLRSQDLNQLVVCAGQGYQN